MFKEQEEKVDKIDQQIIELLGLRFEVIREVGRLKAEMDSPNFESKRIQNVLDHAAQLAHDNKLDPEFIRHIYTIMIGYSHEIIAEMRH